MAGAYLTIGAKFRPFSYDELMKPVSSMAAAHTAIDEQYAAMQEKANVWENLANKETDKVAYARYKSYSDALKAQADDLAANGLNTQSMKNMLDLRARYSSDIVPLEQAYTRRRQLADEQRKMIMQNPTLKFQRDMSTTSLDDFVNNPELDYGYSVNGAMIAKQASEAYSHLAKSIQQEPQYKHILNNNYYQSMLRSGYTPEQILALARNDDSAPAELRQISQQIYDSTGVEDFIKNTYPNASTSENEALQAQEWRDYVNSYINQGAWSAVGTTNYGTVADPDAALRRSLALQAARAKHTSTTSGGEKARTRNDYALLGKTATQNNKHYLGTYETAGDTRASKILENRLRKLANTEKKVDMIVGYNEDGTYDTKAMKKKDVLNYLDDKNNPMDIVGYQLDYDTGDIIITANVGSGKRSQTVMFKVNQNDALNNVSSGTINNELKLRKEIELAKNNQSDYYTAVPYEGRWIIVDRAGNRWYEEDLIDSMKDRMYDSAASLIDYSGANNINAAAGQKLSDSRSYVQEDDSYIPDLVFAD